MTGRGWAEFLRNTKGGEQKMVIDIKDGDCVTNIIENFLLNILQEAYYDNEFKPGLIETMEYVDELDEKNLKFYVFGMLFRYRIVNALNLYIIFNNEISIKEFINALVEVLEQARNKKYVDKYLINLNSFDITISYNKDDSEDIIVIKL